MIPGTAFTFIICPIGPEITGEKNLSKIEQLRNEFINKQAQCISGPAIQTSYNESSKLIR